MSEIKLEHCPFCGGEAESEPWHGGAPTKVMICCSNNQYEDEDGGCSVGPEVTGETPEEAACRWNRRVNALKGRDPAKLDALVTTLRAYEQWEADVLLSDEAWQGGLANLPTIPQDLWDRLVEIQGMRNDALAAFEGNTTPEGTE